MDTNIVTALIQALAAQKAVSPVNYDFWIQFGMAAITFLAAASAWLRMRVIESSSKVASERAAGAEVAAIETKNLAVETTAAVGKIEVEVNSKASLAAAQIATLKAEIATLREKDSFREGKKEGTEAAKS